VTNQNCMHEKMKNRLNLGMPITVQARVLSYRLLAKNTKMCVCACASLVQHSSVGYGCLILEFLDHIG
jgi:hypothetical protein